MLGGGKRVVFRGRCGALVKLAGRGWSAWLLP